MSSRLQEKERRRRAREEAEARAEADARRRQRLQLGAGGLIALLAVAAVAVALGSQGGGASEKATTGSEGASDFGPHYQGLVQRREAAGVSTMAQPTGAVHIHPILKVYANGQQIPVPANIGIDPNADPGQMAGLHTHDAAGTIHVEGMANARLGEFFDIWGVPFSATRLGPYRADAGHAVRMWVDGKPSSAFGQLALKDGQQIVISYQSRKNTKPPT